MIKQLTMDDLFNNFQLNMIDLYKEHLKTEGKNIQIIPYGISDSYVPYWTMLQAVIEYIANFYDANGTEFTLEKVDGGVILEDQNERGITLEDLVIGNSSSREATKKIGLHGEGAKLSGLVQSRNKKAIFIETIGMTILFFLEHDSKLNSNILKSKVIPNNRTLGSKVFLETDFLEEAKERFTFLNENLIALTDFIYKNEKNSKNYIYVNTLASQEIHSYFSYSLSKKQVVNRDRTMLDIPYEDILVSLFTISDKEAIREWLSCMSKEGFELSFEYELLEYFVNHCRKKALKSLDLSLFQEVAKELEMQYIGHEGIDFQTAYLLAHPKKHLVQTKSYTMSYFCEKFLNIPIGNKGLFYGFKEEKHFYVPILNNDFIRTSLYQKILDLYQRLNASAVLKNVVLNDDTLHFHLKPNSNEKIDLIAGKTSKTNISIRSAINSLYNLSKEKKVSFLDFDFKVTKKKTLPYITLKEFPNSFQLKINDEDVLSEMESNVLFMDCKTILKDNVFQTDDGKNYSIDSHFQLNEEIIACFSYRETYEFEYTVFLSPTIVKTFLEKIKENPTRDDLYEFEILSTLLAEQETYSFKHRKNNLKKVLSDQFIKVFGSKTVISSSEQGDKKAIYNHYSVLKVNPILKNYFIKLNTNLSENIKGLDSIDYDIIKKPDIQSIDDILKKEYKHVFSAAYTLYNSLSYLYEMTKDVFSDSNLEFVQSVLPYHHSSNDLLRNEDEVKLNNSNYKKIIKEYCFKVFDRTYLVEAFDEENQDVNGLNSKGHIFVKNPFSLGTFIHEYVHFSTDLLDISERFEKTLSFMNITVFQFSKPSDKEINTFFNEYKKWLGVL